MNAPRIVLAERQIRLTVDDYLLLDREGALAPYGRTELIDGVILPVAPQYRPHAYAKAELAYRLRRALEVSGSDLYAMQEVSVALSSGSMPMPDILLTTRPRGEGAVPVAAVQLIVEVSASTQDVDLGPKAAVYAGAGVPEYWVIDVEGRRVHQMWRPGPEQFAERRELSLGEPLTSATLDGLDVETTGLA